MNLQTIHQCKDLIDTEVHAGRWSSNLDDCGPIDYQAPYVQEFFETYGKLQTELDYFDPNITSLVDFVPIPPDWQIVGISEVFAGHAVDRGGRACAYSIDENGAMKIEHEEPTIWHLVAWLSTL